VPSLGELALGQVEISRLRPVTVNDLLGREPVKLDEAAISEFLRGKCVLVTGGGGSIGSELCRQIARHGPAELVIVDRCEYNIYAIERDLKLHWPSVKLRALLGDVRDGPAINKLFRTYRPEVVFHAAAYKHVPLVEENPIEGVLNNVFGTKIVADAAHQYGTGCFVFISTDKTVNPVNIMGATKRIGEIYCQNLGRGSDTHFITTRFGNVLASAGSVIPLFEKQIAAGGPVTVTHPEVTRYFMTIPEAVGLILQAGASGAGGEIFVLDMGEPIRIYDLAEKMIQLSGLRPDQDIPIAFVGLRLGEKLHEELFYSEETLRGTTHPKLLLAACCQVEWGKLTERIQRLERRVRRGSYADVLASLKAIVPQFAPTPKPIEALPDASQEKTIRLIK
jgi:FlaA1/EpsC-like NDP-sugar epimerase